MAGAAVTAQTGTAQEIAAEIRAVFRRLKARLRENGGGHDLTPSQISVLLRLERGGALTVSSLARAEGMRPQSMRAIVLALQEQGLIRGTPDPSDGRQTLISLTRKCVRWLTEGRTARQDWLASEIARKFSVREQQQVQAAVKLLARLAAD